MVPMESCFVLLFVFLSLILGMGLPTTVNYIVVSSLLAPVIVALGAQSGLIVPLIAVHLFVFYFGIMADVTPPVGLASFAAAAEAFCTWPCPAILADLSTEHCIDKGLALRKISLRLLPRGVSS